jgi:predicted site-specific integrase-resolvase
MTMTVKRRRGNTIHIPEGTVTTATLAQKVGISKDTIERWRNLGLLPYRTHAAGQLSIYIYDADAVDVALALAKGTGKLSGRVSKRAA